MGINVSEEDGLFDFHVPEEFDTALKPSNGSDQAYEQADGLVVEDQEYRDLSATDLGLEVDDGNSDALSNVSHFLIDSIHTDDPTILEIVGVLEEYSGAILSGAPGTSKSYYAIKTAEQITSGDWERIANVQFHPSYQYEDFIEGYRPSPNNNGFELKSGIFLEMCQKASESDQPFVFVIDELSRGDAARVFGEALTYVEKSKRGISFTLPSGTSATIPSNVYLIATMNPVDRGADEVDVAFGRRFGTIEMNPSPDILQQRLQENGLDAQLLGPLMNWFSELNTTCIKSNLPGLGQAFFWNVHDSESLRRAWKYQILPHLKKVFQFDVNSFRKFQNDFDNIFKAD